VSGFDVTQRFSPGITYDLPFFKGMRGAARTLLAGWQVQTVMILQSGFPAPVTNNVDTTGTGINSRPDQNGNGNLPGDKRTWAKWFNTAVFAEAPFGRFGTSPRTAAFRLPGIISGDLSVNKMFRISEHRHVQFRTEIFNLT